MAALTFRDQNTTAIDGSGIAVMDEVDVTLTTTLTGWTVAKLASPQSSDYVDGSERASGTFSSNTTSPKPTDPVLSTSIFLRSTNPYSGTFDNANWTLTFVLRSVTAAAGTVRVRVRLYYSSANDGTGLTQLTSSALVGTTTAAMSTSADATSVVTWAPGATVTVTNAYLYVSTAIEVVTAGSSNSSDALVRVGSSTTGTRLVTANFTAAALATSDAALFERASGRRRTLLRM